MKKFLSAIIAIAMVVSMLATGFVASTGAAADAEPDNTAILDKFAEAQEYLWLNGPYWSTRATTFAAEVGLLKFTSGSLKGYPDYLGQSKEGYLFGGTSPREVANAGIAIINMIANDGFSHSYTHDADGFITMFPEYESLVENGISTGEAKWNVGWPAGKTAEQFLLDCKAFNAVCHKDDVINLSEATTASKIWGCNSWAEAYKALGYDLPDGILPAYNNALFFSNYETKTEVTADPVIAQMIEDYNRIHYFLNAGAGNGNSITGTLWESSNWDWVSRDGNSAEDWWVTDVVSPFQINWDGHDVSEIDDPAKGDQYIGAPGVKEELRTFWGVNSWEDCWKALGYDGDNLTTALTYTAYKAIVNDVENIFANLNTAEDWDSEVGSKNPAYATLFTVSESDGYRNGNADWGLDWAALGTADEFAEYASNCGNWGMSLRWVGELRRLWGVNNWEQAYAAFGYTFAADDTKLTDPHNWGVVSEDVYKSTGKGEAAFYTWFMNLLSDYGYVNIENPSDTSAKVLNALAKVNSDNPNEVTEVIELTDFGGTYNGSEDLYALVGNSYNQMGQRLINAQLGEFIIYADSLYYFAKRAIEEDMDQAIIDNVSAELQDCIDIMNAVMNYLKKQVGSGLNKPGKADPADPNAYHTGYAAEVYKYMNWATENLDESFYVEDFGINLYVLDKTGRFNNTNLGWYTFDQIRNIPELRDYYHLFEVALKTAENYKGAGVLYTEFVKNSKNSLQKAWDNFVNAVNAYLAQGFVDTQYSDAAIEEVTLYGDLVKLLQFYSENVRPIYGEEYSAKYLALSSAIVRAQALIEMIQGVEELDASKTYSILKAIGVESLTALKNEILSGIAALNPADKNLAVSQADIDAATALIREILFIQQYKSFTKEFNKEITTLVNEVKNLLPSEEGKLSRYVIAKNTINKETEGVHYEYNGSLDEKSKSNLNNEITVNFNLHYFTFVEKYYQLEDLLYTMKETASSTSENLLPVVPQNGSVANNLAINKLMGKYFFISANGGEKFARSVAFYQNDKGVIFDAHEVEGQCTVLWDYGFTIPAMGRGYTWNALKWWYDHNGETYDWEVGNVYTNKVPNILTVAFGDGYAREVVDYFNDVLDDAAALVNGKNANPDTFADTNNTFHNWDKKYPSVPTWDWETESFSTAVDVYSKVVEYVENIFGYIGGPVDEALAEVIAEKLANIMYVFHMTQYTTPANANRAPYATEVLGYQEHLINNKMFTALWNAVVACTKQVNSDALKNLTWYKTPVIVSNANMIASYEAVVEALKPILTERGITRFEEFEADLAATDLLNEHNIRPELATYFDATTENENGATFHESYNYIKFNANYVMNQMQSNYSGQLMYTNVVEPLLTAGNVVDVWEDVAVYDWQYAMDLSNARQKVANISTLFTFDAEENILTAIEEDVPLYYLLKVRDEIEALRATQYEHCDPYLAQYSEAKLASLIADAHALELGVYASNGLAEAIVAADTLYYARKPLHDFSPVEMQIGYNKCLPTAAEIDEAAAALAAAIESAKESYLGGSREDFDAIVAEARAICAQYSDPVYAEKVAAVEAAIEAAKNTLNYNDVEWFTENVTWVVWSELIDSINNALNELKAEGMNTDELSIYADNALANNPAAKYTAESYAALTEAVSAAKAVAAKGEAATVAEIANAKAAIDKAVAALVKVDISDILAAVADKYAQLKAEYEALDATKYTAETYNAFGSALTALEAGINEKVADDAALQLLVAAMNAQANLKLVNAETCDD